LSFVDVGRFFIFFFPKTILHSNPVAANVEIATMSVASGVGPVVVVPEWPLMHVLCTRAKEQSHQAAMMIAMLLKLFQVYCFIFQIALHNLSNTSVTDVPAFAVVAMISSRLSAAVGGQRPASAASDRNAQMTGKTRQWTS
jgi:quinol-cytochrome oxidoreductase complex cytochrome b subunit